MSPNPKNGLLERTKIDITFLWEDPEAKLLTPDQLLGYPWKLWEKSWNDKTGTWQDREWSLALSTIWLGRRLLSGPLIYFSVLCVLKHDYLVWQIAAFDPDPTVKGKVIVYRKLFIALFFQQFCWLLWDSVNTVSIRKNSYKTKPMPCKVESGKEKKYRPRWTWGPAMSGL